MSIFDKNFGRRVAAFKRHMPRRVEKEVEKWYKNNFKLGGWQVSKGRVIKWQERTRRYGHKTLDETGSLKNSIKARISGDVIIVSYGDGRQSRGTANDDYGRYHNEGDGNVQRKFFGDSEALTKHLEEFILNEMKKIVFR